MCKDKQGYTALHAAAVNGHLDVIKYLLRLEVEVWQLLADSCLFLCSLCLLYDCTVQLYLPLTFMVCPLHATVTRDTNYSYWIDIING